MHHLHLRNLPDLCLISSMQPITSILNSVLCSILKARSGLQTGKGQKVYKSGCCRTAVVSGMWG